MVAIVMRLALAVAFVTAVAALPQHRLDESSSESHALESRHEAGGLEARMAQMERSLTEQFATFTEQILDMKMRNRKLEKRNKELYKLMAGNAAEDPSFERKFCLNANGCDDDKKANWQPVQNGKGSCTSDGEYVLPKCFDMSKWGDVWAK